MFTPNRKTGQAGFTIVELMVVVAIAAILAMVAIPSLRDVMNNMRQSSAANLLMSDLNHARAEAIKRNARVLVCRRNTAGTDCNTAGTATDWSVGWVVCSEAAVANTCMPGTADNPNPVLVRPPLHSSLTLTASAVAIRFNANSSQGTGAGTATVALGGTWSGATTRTVSVAGTGSISK